MRLSIIMPTIGRFSLWRALNSLVPQLEAGDEVLLVGDGPQPIAKRASEVYGTSVRYVEHEPTHCFGNAQRQAGLAMASGDYVLFLDDDDILIPSAFAVVRDAIRETADCPMLFQHIDRNGLVLWIDPVVRMGNVSTAQIVFPNRPEYLGAWKDVYEGDYWFIRSTLDTWPGGDAAVVWRPNILADCRPGARY